LLVSLIIIHKEQRMKRARVGIIAAAILAVASVTFAQKPDFSGTWTLDAEASGMAAGGGGGGRGGGGRGGGALGNGPSTVKQTADAITIERTMGDNKVTLTYKLDGTESKNTMMGRGGAAMESVSTAKWDGTKLIISTKAMGGQMGETTQSWSLAGNVLTVESTGGRGGAQKRVYKKTT
jgi:hypothetical protein